jgi:hypothetical protein
MIISQQVFSDNIKDTKSTLANMSRVDGTLYGDTKLYYATDVIGSIEWTDDDEAKNLLNLHRPENPECQAITIDKFRMIPLTVDNYLSKRAFATESAFSDFTSVMLGWIRETKKIYDATLFNTFVGTNETTIGKQSVAIELPAAPDGDEVAQEAYNRTVAQTIAKDFADLIVDLEDVSRDYNDYGNLRSYSSDDFVYVWNSEWVNKITKMDVPTIFHKEGLIDKFAQHTLPARYFGSVNVSGGTTTGDNKTVRSLIETDYGATHVFPGDLLPGNTAYEANTTYGEDTSIICKIYHKNSVPYMSAFEVGTSFFNPKSLTETHYLTFGHNTLEYLKNYPFITVKGTSAP